MGARTAALLVLLALLCQGCVNSPEARNARMERHIEAAETVLEQKSDADSLAVAGLLRSSGRHSVEALSLLSRASAVEPERADLAWLEIQICRNVPVCDPEAKSARLRALDPSNGAA